jgi:hypothetical protein
MGAFRRIAGGDHPSAPFSGKGPDGRPAEGHPHATILCLDEDGDGFIDEILLLSPTAFSVEERRAIDRLHPVHRRNGHSLVLTPARVGSRSEVLKPALVVNSITPFAPPRHWRIKRDGDFGRWLVQRNRSGVGDRDQLRAWA